MAGNTPPRHTHHLGGLQQSLKNLGFDVDAGTAERLSSKMSSAVQTAIAAGALRPATGVQSGNFSFDTVPHRGKHPERSDGFLEGGGARSALYGHPAAARGGRGRASAGRSGAGRRGRPHTAPRRPIGLLHDSARGVSESKHRLAAARTLNRVTQALEAPEKLDLFEYALHTHDRDADGLVTPSEAQAALGAVGVLMSAADVATLAASVGASDARDGYGHIDPAALVSEIKCRTEGVDAVDAEARGASPSRLNRRAVSDRIVSRTLAASPSARPAGDSTRFINRRHLTAAGHCTGAEMAAMRSTRFQADKPGDGIVGLKETVFADDAPFPQRGDAASLPSAPRQPSSRLIADKLLDRLVDHVPDKPTLRRLTSTMKDADVDGDGELSLPQFQQCLASVGLVVSVDDAGAIADAAGANGGPSVFGTSHVAPADIVRAVHSRVATRQTTTSELPFAQGSSIASSPVHQGLLDGSGVPTQHRRSLPPPAVGYNGLLTGDAGEEVDTLYDVHGHKLHGRVLATGRSFGSDKYASLSSAPDMLRTTAADRPRPSKGVGAAQPMNPTAVQLAWSVDRSASASARSIAESEAVEQAATSVRKRLRSALPADRKAARTVLRHMLRRVDGDRDGLLSITELNRGLRAAIGADVSSADVVKVLRAVGKSVNVDTDPITHGQSAVPAALHADRAHLDIDALTEWLVAEDGGHGVPTYRNDSWKFLAKYGGGDGSEASAVGQDGLSSQAFGAWASPPASASASVSASAASSTTGPTRKHRSKDGDRRRQQRRQQAAAGTARSMMTAREKASFETFRVVWESRHGTAGARELRQDLTRKPPGPTWSSAHPRPFRVVKPSVPPPPPSSAP